MTEQTAMIIVGCSQCGQKMKVPAHSDGKTFKCVKCAAPIRIGVAVPASPPPPPPPSLPAAPVSSSGRQEDAAPEKSAPKGRVGEILVAQKLISDQQLWTALEHQATHGGRILQVLMDLGFLNKDDMHACLSKQPGVAAIDLARFKIDKSLLGLVPKDFALERGLIPIDRLGKLLTVAMACPLDTGTIEELTSITGLRVNAVLSKIDAIMVAIEKYYTTGQAGDSAVLDDSYFEKILGPTHGKQPEEAAPAGPEPLTAASASKSAPPPAAPPAKPEKPLSQDVLASLRRLSEDPTATLHDVYTLVKDCPPLTRALLAVAGSDVYDIGGQAQNLATALALVDKSGTAALAEHILAGTIEV